MSHRSVQRNKGRYNVSTKSQRADEMARKRDERVVRQAYKKEKKAQTYLADDANYQNFKIQLAKLKLQLRDIPGDGNCLFRALGDQLEGHGRNHFNHRIDTVNYMKEHRKDFEPFVEDDVSFEKHIENLRQPGTYAGNDAIVAFARLNKLKVVIHQLDSPCWQISGTEKVGAKELHISYHNGDHYSSVRQIGDNTETPANIWLKNSSAKPDASVKVDKKSPVGAAGCFDCNEGYSADDNLNGDYNGMARAVRNVSDVVDQIMITTGFMNPDIIHEMLTINHFNVDLTTECILQMCHGGSMSPEGVAAYNNTEDTSSMSSQRDCDSGIWSENGTATRIFGSGASYAHSEPSGKGGSSSEGHGMGTKPKTLQKSLTTREKNKQKKLDKKKRAEERHRQKVLGLEPQLTFSDEEEGPNPVIHQKMEMLSL